MSDMFDTAIGAVSGVASKFKYGPRPAAFMWKLDSTEEAESTKDTSILAPINSARESLQSLVESPKLEGYKTFKFDAVMSEGHNAQTNVTKFPVSSGFLVSDHIINQNRVLVIEAVAANLQNSAVWAASVEGLSVLTGSIFNNPVIPVIGGVYGLVSSAFETENRVESTYAMLNGLRTSGTLIYVSTILGIYLNCVITGLRTKQDKMTGSILAIEITLEELQVTTKSAEDIRVQKALEQSYDYTKLAKVVTSLGIGVLGGVPLPGLGSISRPTAQLSTLNSKLSALTKPVSAVKGLLL